MHNTESARLHASSLLARLGIVVADREASYPYELVEHEVKLGPKSYFGLVNAPALETARKFNSGK